MSETAIPEAQSAIEQILIARQGRAEALHDRIIFACEEIRTRLDPDSPAWLRNVFNELHAAHHILGGDPFDMHMRAALAAALLKADQDATERAAKVAETAEIEARDNRLVKAHMQPDHCSYHLHEERAAQRIASAIRGEGRQG